MKDPRLKGLDSEKKEEISVEKDIKNPRYF
jgi:hypothetical protein